MTLYFSQKSKIPSLSDINYDLDTKNQWPHLWKMSFNLDPNEEATEVLLSSKIVSDDHAKLTFNGNHVQQRSSQNHLGLFQDNKIDFNKLLDEKINKCIEKLGMMKKKSLSVSRKSLLTNYKSFLRPNLYYTDTIYDKAHKVSFIEKIERCNTCLVITDVFKVLQDSVSINNKD